MRPGELKVIPLHSHGTFWVGAGGNPGPSIKVSVTDYQMANELPEMWKREKADTRDTGSGRVAVNLSPYLVGLHWFAEDGRRRDLTLHPFGRADIGRQTGRIAYGEKDFGNGEVARVLFLPSNEGEPTIYNIFVPRPEEPFYPLAFVDALGDAYKSVRVYNAGPRGVGLVAWFIPFAVPVGEVYLQPRETRILPLFDYGRGFNATIITAQVASAVPDDYTDVHADEWTPCQNYRCERFFTTARSLTGSATGLDAGQVQLSMQGRLLAADGGDLNLARGSVDLIDLLDEAGAAGELVDAAASGSVRLLPSLRRGATTVFRDATSGRRADFPHGGDAPLGPDP